jgi:NAD(P)-dependent dehydrogenase (short-subunit alcohol dehydrogenase family)
MITGAAGNVGSAIALAFARTGAALLLADTDIAKLSVLEEKLPVGSCERVQLDVASYHDWLRVAQMPEAKLAELDALILSAGIEGPVAPVEAIEEADFDNVMNVNVKGIWLGLKTCLPRMKEKRGGAIIAIASVSGRMGMPLLAPYCASKHAVIGLIRSTAREVAADGIRVNAIAPGPIQSEMMERVDERLLCSDPNRFGGRKDARQSVPLGRYVTPEEVAALALFLCSELSSGCTGGVFAVDGGIGTW